MDACQAGLVRALCLYDVLDYAPVCTELVAHWDAGLSDRETRVTRDEAWRALDGLTGSGIAILRQGRMVLRGREVLIMEHAQHEALFSRKLRRARRVARWLARLAGVRFVALCNTTAMAHSRDKGDLDFFLITQSRALWQTRLLAALPFKFLRMRPGEVHGVRDAVCLSFFVDDTALDLHPLCLPGDDVYFRHWFLDLLPLFDDGMSQRLWQENAWLRARHPFVAPWILHPAFAVKKARLAVPTIHAWEGQACDMQGRAFPASVRMRLNQDTCIVANKHVIKMHVKDGRLAFREAYAGRCASYGVDP